MDDYYARKWKRQARELEAKNRKLMTRESELNRKLQELVARIEQIKEASGKQMDSTFMSNGWDKLRIDKHYDNIGRVHRFSVIEEWKSVSGQPVMFVAKEFEIHRWAGGNDDEDSKLKEAKAYVELRAKAKAAGHPSVETIDSVSVDTEGSNICQHVLDGYKCTQCKFSLDTAERREARYFEPYYAELI